MAKKRKNPLTNLRAKARKEHFANGGTLEQWRGNARTLDNKTKAKASREACRGNNHAHDH